jgi:hypothetical protein
MLNPRVVRVDEAQSFSIVCLDRTDAPVAVIAGRIYGDSGTLAQSISCQNFIYGHGVPAPAGPRFESWAQNLHEVKAPFSYIGALWVHPNSRGLKLARLLPPLTRGYALARWSIKFDVGLASDEMVRKGMAEVYGYTRVESGFRAYGLADGEEIRGTFLWMGADDIVHHMRLVLMERLSHAAPDIIDGTADKKA